jgi:hypothetical protein
MLGTADLLHLAYTPDLTEAGIAYVCRSLALARPGKAEPSIHRLQRNLAGVAVELAFRRYLQSQSIRFSVASVTPFADPDHYDVSLGGKRCELVSYFISHAGQVSLLRQDASLLLQAPALIPSDEFAAEYHRPDDIILFAFLLGSVSAPVSESPPACWMHLLPKTWSRPRRWHLLKGVTLKNEPAAPLIVELGGLNVEHEFLTARLEVSSPKPTPVQEPFYSLAYLRTLERPQAPLGLRLPGLADPYIISSAGWENLGISGTEIILAGWLSHEEFRRRASFLSIGSRTFQFDRTRVKNLSVPLDRLEPLASLVEKGKR